MQVSEIRKKLKEGKTFDFQVDKKSFDPEKIIDSDYPIQLSKQQLFEIRAKEAVGIVNIPNEISLCLLVHEYGGSLKIEDISDERLKITVDLPG